MHMQSRHQLLRRQCCRLLSAMRDCPNASVRRCPMDNAMARLSLLIAAFRLDAYSTPSVPSGSCSCVPAFCAGWSLAGGSTSAPDD